MKCSQNALRWVILFLCLSYLPALKAQDIRTTRISLHTRDLPLREIFLQIEKSTGLTISYPTDDFDVQRKLNLALDSVTVEQALRNILGSTGYTFSQSYRTVVIVKKKEPLAPRAANPSVRNLTGTVTDASGGSFLEGATVEVRGTPYLAITDVDGHFSFSLPASLPADLTLSVTSVGYSGRIVHPGNQPAVTIALTKDPRSLNSVTVEAKRRINTEATLLNERRMAAVVSDGISAQNIEKTASITTTQALQRVTGVTITDDKYVAIRGLGDRSVIAELNGVRLSSSNPDRSAVPLDLVPASLLDNLTVYKTLTPDHPADAAGGIVELKTRSVPKGFTINFTAESGFNSTIGIRGQFNAFRNFDPGYFGQNIRKKDLSSAFLDLSKQYPGGLQQIQQLFIESRGSQAAAAEALRINNLMWSFDPVITTSYQTAQPNRRFNVSAGNTFKIFHGHELGIIVSADYYHRTEDRYQADLTRWSIEQGIVTGSTQIYNPLHIPAFSNPDALYLGKYLSYKENTGTYTTSYGLLTGLTYRFDALNEINFQYLGSRGAEVQGKNLTGSYDNTGFSYPVYDQVNALQQAYRVFNTYNLQGIHKLFNRGWAPRLTYNLSSSKSSQDEPDYRFTDVADAHQVSSLDANGVGYGQDTYVFVVGTVHGIGPNGGIIADPNGRRYRRLTENNYNAKADLELPFRISGLNQVLKFGYNYLQRDRTFTENELGLPGTLAGGDNGLLQQVQGNLDELVSPNFIGLKTQAEAIGAPRVGGFLYQIFKTANNYHGHYNTQALYGMADWHLSPKLRVIGGVRFETTDIAAYVDTAGVFTGLTLNPNLFTPTTGLVSPNQVVHPNTAYTTGFKPYYSANLVYAFRPDLNLRLAYATSLARPELREITNVYEFDPAQFAVIIGNPGLVNQFTQSADLRLEWFPSSGEVLSASLFGKHIEHQLTKTFSYNSQGDLSTNPEYPVIHFENDPSPGKVVGIELEARKSLRGLGGPFAHLFLGTNLLLDYSEVQKNPARLDASRTMDRFAPAKSPLFEQAPYSINAYLDYDNPGTGSVVTVSFNEVGERLVQVQLDGTPDLYDRPVPLLDAVFSQRLGRFVIRGFAKNILNPAFRTVYTIPGNGGMYRGHTYINHQYYRGAEYALGITYNLF